MAETSQLLVLSGSTDGTPILVTATSIAAGDVIHTCSTDPLDIDRILIKACNNHTTVVDLTIGFGGIAATDQIVYKDFPVQVAETVIVSYSPLKGAASPLVVRAACSTGSVVNITGEVLRVHQT